MAEAAAESGTFVRRQQERALASDKETESGKVELLQSGLRFSRRESQTIKPASLRGSDL